MIIIDTETTGLHPVIHQIHGLSYALAEDVTGYMKANAISQEIRDELNNPDHFICGHNLRFDLKFLRQAGIVYRGPLRCTMLLAQLLDENQALGLKPLSLKYLGYDSLEEKRELDRTIGRVGVKTIAQLCDYDIRFPSDSVGRVISKYGQEDSNNTLRLWSILLDQIRQLHRKLKAEGFTKTPADYYVEESMPLEEVLLDIEERGIRVVPERIQSFKAKMQEECVSLKEQLVALCSTEIAAIEDDLYAAALAKRKSDQGKANVIRTSDKYKTRFKWSSNAHVGHLLYDKLGVPPRLCKRTKTGQYLVGEDQLKAIWKGIPKGTLLRKVLEHYAALKKRYKLINTYTGEEKGLVKNIIGDRVYADYVQAGGPVTGRLSSRNPNMQNLPRKFPEVKQFFVPDPGQVFAYFDYSQIELRVAAHLSQDPQMLKIYRDNGDIHQMTADALGITRQDAKQINFAMIYGASAYRLQMALPDRMLSECAAFRAGFFKTYKCYARYLEEQEQLLRRRGYLVSIFGRIRRLPEMMTTAPDTRDYKHALKQGWNFSIQSAAASICKRTMIALHKANYRLVTQVHDSVVISLGLDELDKVKDIQHIAENIVKLSVPLVAETKLLNSLDEGDLYNAE